MSKGSKSELRISGPLLTKKCALTRLDLLLAANVLPGNVRQVKTPGGLAETGKGHWASAYAGVNSPANERDTEVIICIAGASGKPFSMSLFRHVGFMLSILLLNFSAPAGQQMQLVKNGHSRCSIVAENLDAFSVQRLTRFITQAAPDSGRPTTQIPAGDGGIILLGEFNTDTLIRDVCKHAGVKINGESVTAQGYVVKTCQYEGRPCLLLAGGGPEGTLYAVADFINWYSLSDGTNLYVPVLDIRQEPRFKYRWFWNWDHRMDWGGPGRVGVEMGGGGAYSKSPEAFVIDCKRCLDYMADHKFNGLILWGFLRDTHGGIEAAKEICRYANDRSIRILPGVGTSGYAGYYFEGKHEFNADTWLAKHPQLSAVEEDGSPKKDFSPCPSKPENQQWLDRGAKWLFDNFEVGGVNLEMGDFYVCYCDDCKKARAAIKSSEPDYYKDMAISHSTTLRTMRGMAPDAWLSYATYTGYTAKMMQDPPKFLEMIPDYALCQWTLTDMANTWPATVKPMARHNIGYLHWCNRATKTEDDFYLTQIQAICRNASKAGFEGLVTYGELAPDRPNVELFYLAWENFLWNPEMNIEAFVKERVARLYGGIEPAQSLLEILQLVETREKRRIAENVARARALCKSAQRSASPEARERWRRLIAYLDSL